MTTGSYISLGTVHHRMDSICHGNGGHNQRHDRVRVHACSLEESTDLFNPPVWLEILCIIHSYSILITTIHD